MAPSACRAAGDCDALVHPPVPICPACRSRAWEPRAVSGRATVVGFTVNHHQWLPDFEPPYVIANVALDEDPSVRLTTNIVGCEPDDVHIGQRVAVRFEQHDDVWLPLFEPTGGTDDRDLVGEPRLPAPRRAARAPTGSSTERCCPASGGRRSADDCCATRSPSPSTRASPPSPMPGWSSTTSTGCRPTRARRAWA